MVMNSPGFMDPDPLVAAEPAVPVAQLATAAVLASPAPVDRAVDIDFQRVMLATAVAVLVMAGILRVEGLDRVVLPWLNVPLPGICVYQRWFGVGCPGCGLTRCFVSLAHADVRAAWSFNPAGILLFGFVVGQIPYRGLQLWRARRGQPEIRLGRWSLVAFWSTLATLILQWLVRTL